MKAGREGNSELSCVTSFSMKISLAFNARNEDEKEER